jgi:hypothetical protein
MQITLDIPDDFAAHLIPAGCESARAALEALALEGYRSGKLTESQVRRMLGFEVRMQVHTFHKEHGVYLNFEADHAEQEVAAANQFHSERITSIPSAR